MKDRFFLLYAYQVEIFPKRTRKSNFSLEIPQIVNKFAQKDQRWVFSTLCVSGRDFPKKGLVKVTFH